MIYQGAGEISPYSKTLDSPQGICTSLKEIQASIEEREHEVQDNYEDKVLFKDVQIRLVASNEPYMD